MPFKLKAHWQNHILEVGQKVTFNCYEGFGGPATVIEFRESSHGANYKIRLDDESQECWAFNFEIEELSLRSQQKNLLRLVMA